MAKKVCFRYYARIFSLSAFSYFFLLFHRASSKSTAAGGATQKVKLLKPRLSFHLFIQFNPFRWMAKVGWKPPPMPQRAIPCLHILEMKEVEESRGLGAHLLH
jgi:hypothetical protein